MLVLYHKAGESLVTTLDNEDTLLKNLINKEHGRRLEDYKRVEGDIFELSHQMTVYYTTLDE